MLIFTDIRMPIFDGLEFVGKLREKGISAKTVLISGYKEFEYAKKAITLGVEDYLVKPINPLVLQKILRKNESRIAGGYSRKTGSISSSRNSWWQNRNGRLFF